jgi:hypothetical protein
MNGDTMLRGHTAAFNVSRMNPGDSVAHNTYKASRYKASRYELRKPLGTQKDHSDSNLN